MEFCNGIQEDFPGRNSPCHPNQVPGEHFVNFQLAPDEYLIQCPYEYSHRILPHRMGRHLFRCQRNNREKLKKLNLVERFVKCRWDTVHFIPERESSYHSSQCPSQDLTPGKVKEYLKYLPKDRLLNPPELEQFTEDWEDDSQQYFDPMAKMREQPLIYQPKHLSKAAKKRFREEQRVKFHHMVSGPFWSTYDSNISREADVPELSRECPSPSEDGTASEVEEIFLPCAQVAEDEDWDIIGEEEVSGTDRKDQEEDGPAIYLDVPRPLQLLDVQSGNGGFQHGGNIGDKKSFQPTVEVQFWDIFT